MIKLLLRYGTQGLLVAAPWLASHLGFRRFGQDEQKIVFSLIVLFLIFCWEAFELYLPRQRLRQLGKEYADKLARKFDDPRYPQLGSDLRLNIVSPAAGVLFDPPKFPAPPRDEAGGSEQQQTHSQPAP